MRITLAALFAVLLLAGCGDTDTGTVSSSPDPTSTNAPTEAPESSAVVVDVVIENGTVKPQGDRIDAVVGFEVTLKITSDVDEEIHVHSVPEQTYRVAAGTTIEKTFSLDQPGQVAVEAHELGRTIVQLVVRP